MGNWKPRAKTKFTRFSKPVHMSEKTPSLAPSPVPESSIVQRFPSFHGNGMTLPIFAGNIQMLPAGLLPNTCFPTGKV
jgi:hypothetical protein